MVSCRVLARIRTWGFDRRRVALFPLSYEDVILMWQSLAVESNHAHRGYEARAASVHQRWGDRSESNRRDRGHDPALFR